MNHPTGRPFMLYFHAPDSVENFGYTVAQPHLNEVKIYLQEYGRQTST